MSLVNKFSFNTLLVALWLGNTFDALATTFVIETGKGREVNPAMLWVYGFGWVAFLSVKVVIGTLCTFALKYYEHIPLTKKTLFVAATIYMLLACYHIAMLAIWYIVVGRVFG